MNLRCFCTLISSKHWYFSFILECLYVGISIFSGNSKHTVVLTLHTYQLVK